MEKRRKRRKFKLTKQGRLRKAIGSLLDVMESENENLRYLTDAVLKHFVKDDASFEDFIKEVGGNRARAMLEAVKTLYKGREPFGRKIIERLESIRFTQKLESRNRKIKEAQKTPRVPSDTGSSTPLAMMSKALFGRRVAAEA